MSCSDRTCCIAHVSEDGSRRELVCDHLHEVAEMASHFAKPFGAESWAYAAGLAHDIGKYSAEFQKRILDGGPKVDHSTAGATVLWETHPLLAYCVAGHHSGLPNGGTSVDDGVTMRGRLQKAKKGRIPAFERYTDEIRIDPPAAPRLSVLPRGKSDQAFCLAFLTRMVFSCLVDADFLCTERFMAESDREALRYQPLNVLRDALEERLSRFYPPTTKLNRLRCGVLDDCLEAAKNGRAVYSLTAPTGSGKTYALMRFALQHACVNDMSRVICVEPYTSIIEQNAQVYRDVFGDENVLEHHANFDFDASELSADARGERLRLASENWDAPVVVTTTVQLFESLYANRTSRCRKLHNIANSVVVLDEAQMIPLPFLIPCVKALAELVRNYGCTVLLCSATQPALDRFFEAEGMAVSEIVSDTRSLFTGLQRVTYRSLGAVDNEALARRLANHEQALCIVNSRKQARDLYSLVCEHAKEPDSVFHLTTRMYPEHRRQTLARICELVSGGQPCVVVATSLVEAGVDLDFPVVYRAVTGVDSMVQAAGRCNRENRRTADESIVYLFENASDYKCPAEVRQRSSVARMVLPGLEGEGGDVSGADSLETVAKFFSYLFYVKGDGELDRDRIVPALSGWNVKSASIAFAEVAEKFKLIDDAAHPVIVPVDAVSEEVRRLELGVAARADMRRLARYTVSLYIQDISSLENAGVIHAVAENMYMLDDLDRYAADAGLDVSVEGGQGLFW